MHLMVAAERASLHKVKTEEITKICLFRPEIQLVEISICAIFSNKMAEILNLKQPYLWTG